MGKCSLWKMLTVIFQLRLCLLLSHLQANRRSTHLGWGQENPWVMATVMACRKANVEEKAEERAEPRLPLRLGRNEAYYEDRELRVQFHLLLNLMRVSSLTKLPARACVVGNADPPNRATQTGTHEMRMRQHCRRMGCDGEKTRFR